MKKIFTAIDTEEISLTIYNEGFGAVKEIRKVNTTKKDNELVFADVAQQIEIDSLLVEGLQSWRLTMITILWIEISFLQSI